DASVAIREIVQNAIDAGRLQNLIGSIDTKHDSDVSVHFDITARRLRVTDRGVGMSEQVVQEHFLRVGSSSYQTKEFRTKHPEFNSISRFGIGVLSAFMIADEIRVSTVAEGHAGKEIVLKSVHGTYLIKDL